MKTLSGESPSQNSQQEDQREHQQLGNEDIDHADGMPFSNFASQETREHRDNQRIGAAETQATITSSHADVTRPG